MTVGRNLPIVDATSGSLQDSQPHAAEAKAAKAKSDERRPWVPLILLVWRIAVLLAIVWCILTLHARAVVARLRAIQDQDLLAVIQEAIPAAAVLDAQRHLASSAEGLSGRHAESSREMIPRKILDSQGATAGWFTKTMPSTQEIIGFSGPSDILLVFDDRDRLVRAELLHSGDTVEHVRQVIDSGFLEGLHGQKSQDLLQWQVDGVSGATLTSLAMVGAVKQTLGRVLANENGVDPPQVDLSASLKFSEPPAIEHVRRLFEDATTVESTESAVWLVQDEAGEVLGRFLRSVPVADNVVGYQGPTETLIEILADDQVGRIAVANSYDNEPYVDYLRTDRIFPKEWSGSTLDEAIEACGQIEGVSGATMTSIAVVEGVQLTLSTFRASSAQNAIADAAQPNPENHLGSTWRQVKRSLSLVVIVMLFLQSLVPKARGNRRIHSRLFATFARISVVVVLGVLNGDLLSMALFIGWAQNGLPLQVAVWFSAAPLLILFAVAFFYPVSSGKNVYCAKYCAHGALQQLLRKKKALHIRLSPHVSGWLIWCSPLLLALALLIPVLAIPISPVNLEPFDAWLWTISGIVPIVLFCLSIVASLLVPMAYCRFACPTGRLLDHLRYTRSMCWSFLDSLLLVVLIVAVIKYALPVIS